MTTAEPPGLVLLILSALLAGYIVGFLTVKINYVLIILVGKLFSSGSARGRYALTGFLGAVLVFVFATSQFPALGSAIHAATSLVFAGTFAVGTWHAMRRFGTAEHTGILEAVLDTIFPEGGEIPEGAKNVSSVQTAGKLLQSLPESNQAAIKLVSVIFDSATMRFVLGLMHGTLRIKRFVDLDAKERAAYLQEWVNDPRLFYAVQAFRVLSNFSYYIKEAVWKSVGYDGRLLRSSYLE